MNISGIYKIQSQINPKRIYIGSTKNINGRWKGHLNYLSRDKHHSIKLQRHFNKYGEKDLVFIILEPCLPEFLTIREQYYINKLKPYFNVAKIAGSPMKGLKHTIEAKIKMSLSSPHRRFTEKEKKYISDFHKNKPKSEEHKQNMRKPHGPMSDEHKMKIAKANKGYIATIETRKLISDLHKGKRRDKYKKIS